ncbi:hypothetical protein OF83DRAFT_1041415, partial [Amylostereum chailletii]
GILLPFGSPRSHFTAPNRHLFTPQGRWLQFDGANPLDSWEILSVMAEGRARGIHRADIHGCLYAYVYRQLHDFAARLARFRISFKLFNTDALALAAQLRSARLAPYGLAPAHRFARVDVSNIFDIEYVGLERVVAEWGPLLAHTRHATLVGYLLNW